MIKILSRNALISSFRLSILCFVDEIDTHPCADEHTVLKKKKRRGEIAQPQVARVVKNRCT